MGQPLAYGVGFIAFVLVGASRYLAIYPLVLAHEGGHMLGNLATLRGNNGWTLQDDTNALTKPKGPGIWPTRVVTSAIGYAAPPLLGLAAAGLVAVGNPWAVLLASIVLSVLGVALSRNALAFLVPTLIVLGLAWSLIDGAPGLQAALAVGVAWYLLIGGLIDAFLLPADAGDAAALAGMTLVPGAVWKLLWIVIAIIALIVGGQLLLRPGYLDL